MSQSEKLLCDAHVAAGATIYYGVLEVSNIRHENGDPVTIKKFLGLNFKSPLRPQEILSDPWFQFTPQISTEPLGASTVAVSAKLLVSKTETLPSNLKLKIEIDGDLVGNPQLYEKSVELYADSVPEGIVDVKCAAAPDLRLASFKQVVRLEQDGLASQHEVILGEAILGKTTSFPALPGTYKAVADELASQDQTVAAAPKVSPANFTVKASGHVSIEVTYPEVQKYSALDIKIGALKSPIDREELHVKVIEYDSKKVLADFLGSSNSTTRLVRLPETGPVHVDAEITLNNIKYTAEASKHLSNEVLQVTLDQSAIKQQSVNIESFVTLPIDVDGALQSGKKFSVRIRSEGNSNVVYTQLVQAKTGTQNFDMRVAPGNYTVHASALTDNGTVYAVRVPTNLTVDAIGKSKLHLTTQRGANLKVNGFPNFLSFGGLTDLGTTSNKDFTAARASSLFKYAGNDGMGDPGTYLTEDFST